MVSVQKANPQLKPFQGYIGKRVLLRRTRAEIVEVLVRGRPYASSAGKPTRTSNSLYHCVRRVST
jgi:hypothetical protein